MIQPEPQKQKQSLSQGLTRKLPRLGRTSQLLLVVGISAIVIVALWFVYQQQVPKRAELEATLATFQRTLSGASAKQETSKDTLMAQLRGIEAETEASRTVFYSRDYGPEILDKIIKTARLYDIEVIGTQQAISTKTLTVGEKKVDFQVLTLTLGLKGQVADFQNFLLALGNKVPTAQINNLGITVASTEGEQDKATIAIDCFCYQG
ncbi:MAG: hypothetical protein ACFFH0_11965, partial [Promethearchaeota archaeon]